LLAIWDGKITPDLGGTGHVVQFRKTGGMPGYSPDIAGKSATDLICHVVCGRDRYHGEPIEGLTPGATRWLSGTDG
jgi:hypothetical protein